MSTPETDPKSPLPTRLNIDPGLGWTRRKDKSNSRPCCWILRTAKKRRYWLSSRLLSQKQLAKQILLRCSSIGTTEPDCLTRLENWLLLHRLLLLPSLGKMRRRRKDSRVRNSQGEGNPCLAHTRHILVNKYGTEDLGGAPSERVYWEQDNAAPRRLASELTRYGHSLRHILSQYTSMMNGIHVQRSVVVAT